MFHGYDERLDRPVAIKMLRQPTAAAGEDSPEALELLDAQRRDRVRFLREIRTAARLEHPGTPAVYDTGTEEQPDGTEQVLRPASSAATDLSRCTSATWTGKPKS